MKTRFSHKKRKFPYIVTIRDQTLGQRDKIISWSKKMLGENQIMTRGVFEKIKYYSKINSEYRLKMSDVEYDMAFLVNEDDEDFSFNEYFYKVYFKNKEHLLLFIMTFKNGSIMNVTN